MEVEKGDCFLIFLYGQDKEWINKEYFFFGKNNTDFNLAATDLWVTKLFSQNKYLEFIVYKTTAEFIKRLSK